MHLQDGHLSEYRPWNGLSQLDQKFRDDPRLLVFLCLERHFGDLTKDLVSKLDVVELLGKDIKELGHRFREVFVVLKGLDDPSLCGKDVPMVLHRKTQRLVNAHPDRFRLHMLFRFHDMVDRSCDTPTCE